MPNAAPQYQFQKLEIKNDAHFDIHKLSLRCAAYSFQRRFPGCLQKNAIREYKVRNMANFLETVQKQFTNLHRLEIAVLEGQNALYSTTVKDTVESLTGGQQLTYSIVFSLSTFYKCIKLD